jgi:GWxTD domain-containing protein
MMAILSILPIEKLGWTLLHFLWQGTAIALCYATLRRIAGDWITTQGRYRLACVSLLATVAAPALTFVTLPNLTSSPAVTALHNSAFWLEPGGSADRTLAVVVALWALGVLVFSVRLFGAWRITIRLRRTSHPAPHAWQVRLQQIAMQMSASASRARMYLSPLVNVPTVVGWLRPAILIPIEAVTGWPAEQVTALLAHEMAHVLRNDFLVNLLQSVAEAVLFYHPAVWWISGQIRAERELCCDDLAVRVTDVASYSRALLALESQRPSGFGQALAADGGSLKARIRRLVDPARPRENNLPGPAAAWAMTFLWLAGLGAATLQAGETQALVLPSLKAPAPVASPAPLDINREAPLPGSNSIDKILKRARNTLLYDPVLSVQTAQPAAPANTQDASRNRLNEDITYIITDEERKAWRELMTDDERKQFLLQFELRRLSNLAMRNWLTEDVVYIITDEERRAFLRLNTDEERQQFVEQFWLRRDPTPDTIENEFKQEHYRRLAYANQHFASSVPGWKTERGRIYIMYGPPDEIDSHPSGDGAAKAPYEDWRYRYIQGRGTGAIIEFVDTQRDGEYRMTVDPSAPGQTQPQ